jgi:multidrug efflux pump subunit AcrA (membrane-fusion protein)
MVEDVRKVTVTKGTITKAVVATGEIRPLAEAEVKSRVGGVVRRFFVEEGDRVIKGQRLAEIVPTATPEELVRDAERAGLGGLIPTSERRGFGGSGLEARPKSRHSSPCAG